MSESTESEANSSPSPATPPGAIPNLLQRLESTAITIAHPDDSLDGALELSQPPRAPRHVSRLSVSRTPPGASIPIPDGSSPLKNKRSLALHEKRKKSEPLSPVDANSASWRSCMPKSTATSTPIKESFEEEPDLSFEWDENEFDKYCGHMRTASAHASAPTTEHHERSVTLSNSGARSMSLEIITELDESVCVVCHKPAFVSDSAQLDNLCTLMPCRHRICACDLGLELDTSRKSRCPACFSAIADVIVPRRASALHSDTDSKGRRSLSDESRRGSLAQSDTHSVKRSRQKSVSSSLHSNRSNIPTDITTPNTTHVSSLDTSGNRSFNLFSPTTQTTAATPNISVSYTNHSQPAVLLIEGFPPNALVSSLAAYLQDGIHAVAFSEMTHQPVKMLCEFATGKTLSYAFCEAASFSVAQQIIRLKHDKQVQIPGCRSVRKLSISLTSYDYMLCAIFPFHKMGFDKGLPIFPSELTVRTPLVLPEDVGRLLDFCNVLNPQPFTSSPERSERPFLVLATIVEKYPWNFYPEQCEMLMDSLKIAMHLLVEAKNFIPHWQVLANIIIKTAMHCPYASWQSKEAVLSASTLQTIMSPLAMPSPQMMPVTPNITPMSLHSSSPEFPFGLQVQETFVQESPLMQRSKRNKRSFHKPRSARIPKASMVVDSKTISTDLNIDEELVKIIAAKLGVQG